MNIESMTYSLYCPTIYLDELNQIDRDTILKNLGTWINRKQYIDPYEKMRIQMFLTGLPEIKTLADLLEYSSSMCFKEITGFINYLTQSN